VKTTCNIQPDVNFPVAIPDAARSVDVVISLPLGPGTVQKLSLCLGLTHTWFGAWVWRRGSSRVDGKCLHS